MVGPGTFTLPAHSKYRKANIFISCVVGHDFSGWNRPLGVDAFSRSAAATIHWVHSFGNHRCALLHLVAGPFAEMTPNCYARREPPPDTSVFDPGCVKTCASRECAELFSVLSPFYCDWQQCSFPIERNRDNISTCKFDVGVFTQPGP